MDSHYENVIRIPITSLKINGATGIDIYIKTHNGLVLFKKKGIPFSSKILINLKSYGHKELYISKNDIKEIINELNNEINEILNKEPPSAETIIKAFDKIRQVFEAVLENPNKETLELSNSVSCKISDYVESNPDLAYLVYSTLKKDFTTVGHVSNVFALVTVFASHLGYKGVELKTLSGGAFFHDIGKIKVPDSVLKKPGKLTPDEFSIIKKHPIEGYHVLKQNGYDDYAKIAVSHHKFLDGTGYPEGISHAKLSSYGRIVQICDIYEALIGLRPYKSPLSPFHSMEIIRDEYVKTGKIDETLFYEFLYFLNKSKNLNL